MSIAVPSGAKTDYAQLDTHSQRKFKPFPVTPGLPGSNLFCALQTCNLVLSMFTRSQKLNVTLFRRETEDQTT